jgi:hypothetical protein
MPGIVGNGVTLEGLRSEDFTFTWNISGTAGVSPPIGSPISQDITADNTVKQVSDNSIIIGALMSYENRVQEGITVAAVAHKTVSVFDYTGAAPTRGNSVLGSAVANKVKLGAAGASPGVLVVAVNTTAQTVTVLIG